MRRAFVALLLLAGCRAPYRAHPLQLAARWPDGGALDASALRGQPHVLELWMPNCGQCGRALPALDAERPGLERDGIALWSLALTDEPDDAYAEAAQFKLGMPVLTSDQELLGPNDLKTFPATLYVNAQGIVVDAEPRAVKPGAIAARAREVLRQ